jgi:hypothetical protein
MNTVELLDDLNLLRKYLTKKEIHPREYFELRILEKNGYVSLTKNVNESTFCVITKKTEKLFI